VSAFFKYQSIYSFCIAGAIGSFFVFNKTPDRATADSHHYNPKYITHRDKERFSQQEDYLQKARQIIEMGESLIKASAPGGEKELFSSLLSYFSKARASLAKAHNTENFEDFGKRRDLQGHSAHSLLLKDVYEECGTEVLSWMREGMQEMVQIEPSGKLKMIKESHVIKSQFLGCESCLYFELFTPSQVDTWNKFSRASNLDLYVPSDILQKKERGESLSKKERRMFVQAQKRIQALYPDYDEGHDMSFVLELMDWESASQIKASECYLIRATSSLKMNGNIHFLTRYNALLPATQEAPLEIMKKLGSVLLHQDVSLIQGTLDEVTSVFQRVMKWDGKDLSSLQDQMAVMTYLLVHNMRDIRGSAAENEWLVHAIYGALNVQISEDSNKLQDLEAFGHPLLIDFVSAYKNMIKLEHKTTNL
jgi:hypothetical protein